jgi:hypothetical protein
MLKKTLVASTAFAVLTSTTVADAKTHNHHKSKLEKQIEKVVGPVGGGAAGYAVAGPIGAAVGVGAGYVATHKVGHKANTVRYSVPAYPGFTYRDGLYYDDYGHYFTYEQMVKHYGTSNYRQKVRAKKTSLRKGAATYAFAEKYGTYDYPGFKFHDGVYWDKNGHWYAPSYMYRYHGPSVYRKKTS